MQLKAFAFLALAVTVLSSPVELDEKLRSFLGKQKHLSLKGIGASISERNIGSSLTASERDELLQLHNNARNSVNPPADYMPQMTWSPELATVAQNYAYQCIWTHNSARSSQANGFYYVGENLFVTTASSGYLESGVASWVNEKKDYNYATNSCSNVCGHYTQVVWAESTKVGCAVANCASMQYLPSYFSNVKFLVCNYGPGGNYIGELPYDEGSGTNSGSSGSSACK